MEIHIFELFGMIQHLNIGKTSSQMPQTAPSDMASEDRTAVAIRSYGSCDTRVLQLPYGVLTTPIPLAVSTPRKSVRNQGDNI